MSEPKEKQKGIFSSIFFTYFILIFHGLLIVGLAFLVVFFRGVVEYMEWIVGGGITLVLLSGFLFYRKLKKSNRDLRDIINDPAFKGKSLEISFLGGVASVKVGSAPEQSPAALAHDVSTSVQQLEDPETVRIRDLGRLAHLLEQELITKEEYEQLKKDLLHQAKRPAATAGPGAGRR